MNGISRLNLGVGLTALIGGLTMLAMTLRRHKLQQRVSDPKGVVMLIAGMMITAFGLYITAFTIAFATGEHP